MVLDPTARTANIKDSIKKYFVDNIFRTSGIALTFDKALSVPKLQGQTPADRWVSIRIEELDLETLSSQDISVYCCTRKDPEGFRLAQTIDTVMGYLTDSSQTDGFRRIPFYRSYESQAWVLLGALLVTKHDMSGELEGPDETKFRIITIRLQFPAKV